MTRVVQCETCGGEGVCIEFRRFAGEYQAGEPIEVMCHECGGEGEWEDDDEQLTQAIRDPLKPILARDLGDGPHRPFGSALTKGDGAMVERCPRIGPTVRLRGAPPCPACGNSGRYHCECEVEL